MRVAAPWKLRDSLALSVMALTGFVQVADAQTSPPVAIVEEASDNAPVRAFDYLTRGQQIRLAGDATVSIGYLASCRLETISGGIITVGEKASVVSDGVVDTEQVDCDGGSIELTPEAAAASGVTIYRAGGETDRTLYSATPVFILATSAPEGTLEIDRLDRPEPTKIFKFRHGRVDLADASRPLNPGGLYQARYGSRRMTFRIVVYARPGGPLVGRIAQF